MNHISGQKIIIIMIGLVTSSNYQLTDKNPCLIALRYHWIVTSYQTIVMTGGGQWKLRLPGKLPRLPSMDFRFRNRTADLEWTSSLNLRIGRTWKMCVCDGLSSIAPPKMWSIREFQSSRFSLFQMFYWLKPRRLICSISPWEVCGFCVIGRSHLVFADRFLLLVIKITKACIRNLFIFEERWGCSCSVQPSVVIYFEHASIHT